MQNEIYFGYDLLPENILEHYGIPRRSGRYPWGSGEDPYHHGADGPGGRRSSASISDRIKRRKAVRESVKKAKAAAAEQKAKDEEEKAKQEREKKKQEAISSGDPKAVAPYVRDLSDSELKSAVDRLRLENNFSKLMAEAPKDPTKMEKIKKKLDNVNEFATTGFNTWNNFAKVYNTFADKDDKLPMIGEGVDKKKDKDKTTDNNSNKTGKNESTKPQTKQQTNDKPTGDKPSSAPSVQNDSKPKTETKSTPTQQKSVSEDALSKQWHDEARDIVNQAKSEARKDFRREMATEFSKQLREQQNETLNKKWESEANDIVNQAKSEARKEVRREMASEFSKLLNEQREADLRNKWAEEQEEAIRRARKNRI